MLDHEWFMCSCSGERAPEASVAVHAPAPGAVHGGGVCGGASAEASQYSSHNGDDLDALTTYDSCAAAVENEHLRHLSQRCARGRVH